MSVFTVWDMWNNTIPGIVMDLNAYQQNAVLIQNHIAQKKEEEKARRQSLADAYNAAVNDYNSRAGSLFNDVSSFSKTLADYNIANLNDRSEYDTLTDYGGKYLDLTFNAEKPLFGNTFAINYDPGYFESEIDFMPSLANVDSGIGTNIGNSLYNSKSTLDKLYKDLDTENTRISDWHGGFSKDLNRALSSANSISFADLAAMNSAKEAQTNLAGRLSGFSSVLKPDMSMFEQDLGNLKDRVNTLFTDRSNEEKRIGDFRKEITTNLEPISKSIGSLTIRDADKIVGGQDTLNDLSSKIGAFSSILNPNFSTEQKDITSSLGKLTSLASQRESEINRINNSQSDFFSRALGLTDRANNTDIYSKRAIDSINADTGRLNQDLAGFSSLLDFDFSDSKQAAELARSRISELYALRNKELSDIASTAGSYTAGLNDVPLYEEETFNDRKQSISDQISELNAFTGDDLGPYKGKVQSSYDAVMSRLNDLYNYRGGIEKQSQGLIDELDKTSFYNSKDVQDAMGEKGRYRALRNDADLYRATQADDELNTIDNRYNRELARLLLDERTKAELAAKEAASFKGRFQKQTPLYVKGIPLTENEYQAYVLSRRRQQEELFGKSMGASGFANALGLNIG